MTLRFVLALAIVLASSGCATEPEAGRAACSAGAAPERGAVFYGRVIAEWGDPILDVVVWTETNERYQALTDSEGCYRLAIPHGGQFGILAEKDGFESASKAALAGEGDVVPLDFILFAHRST